MAFRTQTVYLLALRVLALRFLEMSMPSHFFERPEYLNHCFRVKLTVFQQILPYFFLLLF